MRSRARQEKRLLREQDTVGARRAERREQETLGAHPNLEVIPTQPKRREKIPEDEPEAAARPRRLPRPGKPLKR
jgi:hypothetical protein